MLIPVIFIGCLMIFATLRVAVSYSRVLAAMKCLKAEQVAQLPLEIQEALRSRWVGSWQSQVFHEIAIGDITWAAHLSLLPAVVALRRDFRWMILSVVGVLILLFVGLLLSR